MRLLVISALTLAFSSAQAIEPDERLADPALEARAREISRDIRCVVCQSENIDDSNAPLARDLRLLVRERLTAGDSDEAVIDYLAVRYGDFVLLKPRIQNNTILLWAAPIAAAAAGVFGFWSAMRAAKSHRDPPKPLTPEELDALGRID